MPEIILPGTYITVRDEGLITAGRVATGNIGIVGTANKGPVNKVQIIGSFTEARAIFGNADAWQGGGANELTLIRALEYVFNNGGRTVYAVRTAAGTPAKASFSMATDSVAVVLEATSEGTWGNGIQVEISASETANNKKVVLTSGVNKETYDIATAADLATAINTRSALVNTTSTDLGGVPANTQGKENLTGGTNGETATPTDYQMSLEALQDDIINIVVLAGQDATDGATVAALMGHLNITAENKRERIGVIGSNGSSDVNSIVAAGNTLSSDRLIYAGPGIEVSPKEILPGAYMAAAVAGLLSSLSVQTSPTNKVLAIPGVAARFSSSKLEKLVQNRVLAVEQRSGFRIVKGITTATNSAWHQITTRRIVDYAIYGVRSACNPYIGKLNNERVRGAMKATLDGFLTRMVEDEALISYELEVSATRAQQIAGEAIVTMTIRPTFSIDFVLVTMYLG